MGGQQCPCKAHSGTRTAAIARLQPGTVLVLLFFLSLPLSLGGDLWRKMHNMFYLPCGSHKIFTSSSHYSQSESRRALEPSLPDMPPPCAAPVQPRGPSVPVPGLDERPVPSWIPHQGPTFPLPALGDTPGFSRSRGVDGTDGTANTFACPSILVAAQGGAASALCVMRTSAMGSRRSRQRGGFTCPQQRVPLTLSCQAPPDSPGVTCASTCFFVTTAP